MRLGIDLSLTRLQSGSAALSISGTAPQATNGVAYTFTPAISGGTAPYTVSIVTGAIPAWASLNTTTGVVSGTPNANATTSFTMRVTDSASPTPATADLAVSLTVSAVLTISGTPTTTGSVGGAYSFTPTVGGGRGTKVFSLSGSLTGSGLSFDTTTGALTASTLGSAATYGPYTITVTDADSRTASLGAFSLVVSSTIAATFTRINGPSDDPFTAAVAGSFQGWTVNSVGAIADDTAFDAVRQGYDQAGATTTYTQRMYVTRKVRQPAPNDDQMSTSTYAVNEYLLSTDTPVGSVTNNTTLISPKPNAAFVVPDGGVVGNTISTDADPIEVAVGHIFARSGQEAACVIFKITDGTTTISVTVATPTKSVLTTDRNTYPVFRLPATTISSLADGQIKVDAEVYPWIGAAASVAKSATDGWARRGFSTRTYLKNVTWFTTPLYACVDATLGNNSTGVASTTQAVAEASPCLTISGALAKLNTSRGASGIDGAVILLKDGTHVLDDPGSGATKTQKIGIIYVRRASTSVGRSSVIVQGGASVASGRLTGTTRTDGEQTGLRFSDVKLQRNGAQAFLSFTGVQIWDCDYDANGTGANGTLLGAQTWYINGLNCTSFLGGLNVTTASEIRLVRGMNVDMAGRNLEGICVFASNVSNCAGLNFDTTRTASGAFVAGNQFRKPSGSTFWSMGMPSGSTLNGLVNSQNLFEFCQSVAGHCFSVSNDSAAYHNTHVVEHGNTYAGTGAAGRCNLAYDEGNTATSTPTVGTAVARQTLFYSPVGNIYVAAYTKGDLFHYYNEQHDGFTSGSPSTRVGNWAFKYAVGHRGNFSQSMPNTALGAIPSRPTGWGIQNHEWAGYGTVVGNAGVAGVTWNNSSETPTRCEPGFVSFQATTHNGSGYVAGAGSGDYTLTHAAIAKGMVADPVLNFTQDGVARQAANDHCGALSAA